VFLFAVKARWPYLVTVLMMIPLAIGAMVSQASLFVMPFNPFTLNVLALALGLVGYQTLPLVPRAGRCLREPERGEDVDL